MKKLEPIIFWILSITWGIIMTSLGILAAIFLLFTLHKPKRFHYLIYFEIGDNWGGINLGPIFIVDKHSGLETLQHEAGHGIQNIIFGPFFLFVIGLPSLIRCLYRDIIFKFNRKKYYQLPSYNAIWFEGWATAIGKKKFK